MAAAANAAFGDFAKESLDQIEPTGAGGSEVNLVAGMPGKPLTNPGNLVCSIVVHYDVNGHASRHRFVDFVKEAKKFLMAMASMASCNSGTGLRIQRSEQ